MNDFSNKITLVKKFYFLDYFYVLLRSVEKYSNIDRVFDSFKELKQINRLGESKYRKLTVENKNLSKVQLNRYRFTFEQVIMESESYNLIEKDDSSIIITNKGKHLIKIYDQEGSYEFNKEIFFLMEQKHNSYYYLINLFYEMNKKNTGLMIFPIYSPRKLGFNKSDIKTTKDVKEYAKRLQKKIEEDIQKYIGKDIDLTEGNNEIFMKLVKSNIVKRNDSDDFDLNKYNKMTKRYRDYWLSYFLREIYGCRYSYSAFDIWAYRGKQIGIMQATEFHPDFNGRIVYPTSVILESTESKDFRQLYVYPNNKKLFVHQPTEEKSNEEFVDALVQAYYEIKRRNQLYFINLISLREIVCFKMKISERLFQELLDDTYRLSLENQTKIQISLEVDRLPEETNAMYLKREPVMIGGKYRNIIAIDITKREKENEHNRQVYKKTPYAIT